MDARKSRYSSSTQQESCLMRPPGRLTGPDELQDGHARVCCARARWPARRQPSSGQGPAPISPSRARFATSPGVEHTLLTNSKP